jgi:IS66 C-terminal element
LPRHASSHCDPAWFSYALFFGSDDHASAAANLFSLVASCKLHGLDPEAYLADVIRAMPYWPRERYLELAPRYWACTRARLSADELKLAFGPITVPPPLPAEEQRATSGPSQFHRPHPAPADRGWRQRRFAQRLRRCLAWSGRLVLASQVLDEVQFIHHTPPPDPNTMTGQADARLGSAGARWREDARATGADAAEHLAARTGVHAAPWQRRAVTPE